VFPAELGRFIYWVPVLELLKIFAQKLHVYYIYDSTSVCICILVLEDVIGSDGGGGFLAYTVYDTLAVIAALRTEQIGLMASSFSPLWRLYHLGTYSTSILMSAAFSLPLCLLSLLLCLRCCFLDLNRVRPTSVPLGAYSASVLMPLVFDPPLSLLATTAPPFSHLHCSNFDLDLPKTLCGSRCPCAKFDLDRPS